MKPGEGTRDKGGGTPDKGGGTPDKVRGRERGQKKDEETVWVEGFTSAISRTRREKRNFRSSSARPGRSSRCASCATPQPGVPADSRLSRCRPTTKRRKRRPS